MNIIAILPKFLPEIDKEYLVVFSDIYILDNVTSMVSLLQYLENYGCEKDKIRDLYQLAMYQKIVNFGYKDLVFKYVKLNIETLFCKVLPNMYILLNIVDENLFFHRLSDIVGFWSVQRFLYILDCPIQPIDIKPVDIRKTLGDILCAYYGLSVIVDFGEIEETVLYKMYWKFRMGYRWCDVVKMFGVNLKDLMELFVMEKIKQWTSLIKEEFPLVNGYGVELFDYLCKMLEYPTPDLESLEKLLEMMDKEYVISNFSDGCFLLHIKV